MSRRPPRAHPPSTNRASTAVQLTVESLAHGGDSVAHHEGMAVFLQGGVPGDVVKAQISPQGRFARGRVLEVIQPSPSRQKSDCSIHPACGGCPWMEVSVDGQAKAKEQILVDALTRLGKIQLGDVEVKPLVRSARITRYRHRARLHTERHGQHKVLGFLPAKGRGVIPVDACMVLELPLERALQKVARLMAQAPDEPFDVTLSGEPEEHGGKVGVFIEVDGRADPHKWRRLVGLMIREGIQAVEVQARGRQIASSNSVELRYAVAPGVPGGPFLHDASVFTQGNRWQNVAMQQLVLEGLALTGTETVAELHAGSGNFTIPVAMRSKKVVALESHPRAVEYAAKNVKIAGLQQKVAARVVDCDRVQGVRSAVGGKVDALLLDPPRTGAPALKDIVTALEPKRIVYVSCNTATLARDLAHVVTAGFKLRSVQSVDLFPRTWHVEAVAVLERA